MTLRSNKPPVRGASKRPVDRRIRRSRAALTAALTELTFERGYRDIKPEEVAARADVGRSTLYNHFTGLDDLLAQSLDGHLHTLAECSLKPEMDPALLSVLKHFWEQRSIARTILHGDVGNAVSRLLGFRFEEAIHELRRSLKSRSKLSASLIAAQLAAGQLALLNAWLTGRAPASPDEMANHLRKTSYAAAIASLCDETVFGS